MKIGFDVSQTGSNKAGCGYYADCLIRSLIELDSKHDFVLFPTFGDLYWDPDWEAHTFSIEHPNVTRLNGCRSQKETREYWKGSDPEFESRLGDPDIVHSNNFFCPGNLERSRLVFTLHDLGFLKYPEWTTEENRGGCFDGVFNASIFADYVVAVSHSTREHYLETFPHYPEERIGVVYEACRMHVSEDPEQPKSLVAWETQKFWLTVATLEPRKNHLRLIEAYARLKKETGFLLPVIFAGGKGWLMEDLESEIHSQDLDREVTLLGYVNDLELSWLFRNCFAFVYPSLFEGFGLPVLEAMSCGAPVLTSNTSSLPEVAGDAAILADPFSVDSIYGGLARLLKESDLRSNLRDSGLKQAEKFSWKRAAHSVLDIYQETLAKPKYWQRSCRT